MPVAVYMWIYVACIHVFFYFATGTYFVVNPCVHFFIEISNKECIIDIKLKNMPIWRCSKSYYGLDGNRLEKKNEYV